MNAINYLITRKKEYNQFLSTIYFLFNDLPYPISLSVPKKEFDAEATHLIWEIFQEISKEEHKKIEDKPNQKANHKIDKEIDKEFNKAFSHDENTNKTTRREFKSIPTSKRKDPYENFLGNWKENLKYFNVSVLNQLPPDVLFEIINGLQKENKILNDKINSLVKLAQYIDNTSKNDSNEINKNLIKEKYKEDFDLLYQKLKQACIDLINLQETGEIIYD